MQNMHTLEPSKKTPRKSLVLFVDINYTIIVTSSRKGSNKKTGILTLLAEHYSAIWDAAIINKKMTFKDFVKNHLHPHNEQAQIEQYANFFEYLSKDDNHQELLKLIKAEYEAIAKQLNQNEDGDDIFPSFIKLVHHLEANKDQLPYTLILRTFGRDLDKTVAELEKRTPIKFTSHGQFDTDGFLMIGSETKKSSAEIQNTIKPFEHGAWQDNYARWKNNKFVAGGKLFPINLHDENSISIFWDDNIGEKGKKILSIQSSSGDIIENDDQLEERLIQSKHLVAVNPREAIKDDDYFIKLKNCVYYRENLQTSSDFFKANLRPSILPIDSQYPAPGFVSTPGD